MIFALGSIAAALFVVVAARVLRGKWFARFAAVILTIQTASAIGIYQYIPEYWPALAYLQAVTYFHFLSLVRARLRPWWWRVFISIPAHAFSATTFFAMPWALAQAFGYELPGIIVPFLLGALGIFEAFRNRLTDVHLDLDEDREHVDGLVRLRGGPGDAERPLRIVQITDPHLGPFMSPERLRRIVERAIERDPDLVVLTGDFITMESQANEDALAYGLEPLRALEGRTFACLGNHDYEAIDQVKAGLSRAGVRLLVDEAACVETPAGPVQIVGMDFVWRDRAAHLESVAARHPRRASHLRLVLLHDPAAFLALPHDEGDLVLSGHTHGGQLGLVSLGLPYTFLSFFPNVPDHGLWARGRDRLYVHRGTNHYGFPVRLGVPREESVLWVHR